MSDATKLVLFDWGGVIDTTDFEHSYNYRTVMVDAFRAAYKLHSDDYPDDEVWDMLQDAEYYDLSHDGENETTFKEILREKFYKMLPTKQPPMGYIDEYMRYSLSHFKFVQYYKDIIEFQYELAKKCSVGIMSDLNWLDAHRLREQIDLGRFDYVFLSYLCGASKRIGDLYRYVERETGRTGKSIMLIDDRFENIEKAKQLGWNTYECKEHDIVGITSAVSSFLCYS